MPIGNSQTCLIWGANYVASVTPILSTDSYCVDSGRAGGRYTISWSAPSETNCSHWSLKIG